MTASAAPIRAPAPGKAAAPALPGDVFIWLVMALEMLTFCVMFAAFAFARVWHTELFNASQQRLDVRAGAINTVLLLSASWGVARAVRATRGQARGAALAWLGGAGVCGAGFVLLKLREYADKAAQGIGLGQDNLFFDFYYILTGFHLAHVLAGLLALALVGVGLARQPAGALNAHGLETAGAFWHLVDLLWLVLFPLVYVMR